MSAINELLISGYIRCTIEEVFYFNKYIVPNEIRNTILMFVPIPPKIPILVSLNNCQVLNQGNRKFTVYSFQLQIMGQSWQFSARYSSLYKFHHTLFKDTHIQTSFGCNPPIFPGKKWWRDFTKKQNYSNRAVKLLEYMRQIVINPDVQKSDIFQNGVFLPKHLRGALSNTAKGYYYWPPIPVNPWPWPSYPNSPGWRELRPPSVSPSGEMILQYALQDLATKTDELFISTYEDSSIFQYYNSYHMLSDMYLFNIQDVLPQYLIDDDSNKRQQWNHNVMENMKLFKKFNMLDNKSIDIITLDIKDIILEACDIRTN